MKSRKIIANTVFFGIIPKLSLLINIIILPIITPFLTTFDYGIHGIVTSYSSLFVNVVPLGMNIHLTNSFYESPKHYDLYWGRIIYVLLLSSLFCGIISSITLFFELPIDSTDRIFISIIGSFHVFFFAYGMVAQHLYTLIAKPLPLVITNFVASLIGIISSFILIYYLKLGYWGLISSVSLSSFISFSAFAYLLKKNYNIRPIIERNKIRLKENLKIALPLIPHTIGFTLLTSSARIVMSWYGVSIDEIGVFSHGCAIGGYIVIVTTALTTALVPQIQESYRSGNYTKYRYLYYSCQLVSIVSSLLFCVWMPELYDVLIKNEKLQISENIASLICFANVVMPFYTFSSTVAFIQKKTKSLLWLVFVPGFLNILLCCICIPIWGYKVAIYSTIISYWSQLVIPFFVDYYKKTVSQWLGNKYKLIFVLLLIFISLLIGNQIRILPISYKILLSFVCTCCVWAGYKKIRVFENSQSR